MTIRVFWHRWCVRALALATASTLTAAHAADFPSQPVKLLVPTAAGGTADTLARAIAEQLSQAWGQPVVVEQKVGANGMLATQTLIRAAPDGYTALFSLSSVVQNLVLQPNPGYRLSDLQPVSQIATIPIALAANAQVPAKDLAGMLALAREKPGQFSYGTYGIGSGGHVVGAGLAQQAGVDMIHVPYSGEAAGFPDLVSGRIPMFLASVGFYSRQVEAGHIRMLALANPQRLPAFPDVPTFAELGYPQINLPGWVGVFLPANTPPAIVETFSGALQKAVASPEVRARMEGLGYVPVGSTPAVFSDTLQKEITAWRDVVQANNIRID